MVLPAIAVRTFNQFKDDGEFKKLIKHMIRKVQKISNPIKRARYIHSKIDKEIATQLADQTVFELVSCKQGCTACCHTQVAITESEALLLIDHIKGSVSIDWERLYTQADAENNIDDYYKLRFDQRRCIFLDDENNCQVYEDRPSVCRTNYVISDPKNCEVKKGETSSVRLLNTYAADSWVYSQFKASRKNGTLPSMIKEYLMKLSLVDTDISKDL